MEGSKSKEAPIMTRPVDYNSIPWQYRDRYSGLCTFNRGSYLEGDSTEMVVVIQRSKEGPFKEIFANGTVEEGYYKNNRRVGIARRVYGDGRVETLDYGDGCMGAPIEKWFGEVQDRPTFASMLKKEISSIITGVKNGIANLFPDNSEPIQNS